MILNYSWLNLDKINEIIRLSGANTILILGIKLISNIPTFKITINNKVIVFDNLNNSIDDIKNQIGGSIRRNLNVNDVIFF